MIRIQKSKKMKKILNGIKKIKLRTLILLILLLMFSSYAWFVFISTVSVGLEAHVVAWKVTFSVDNTETNSIAIDVGRIYPGMDNYSKNIVIRNAGEVDGKLTYEIQRMVVLGQAYELSDTVTSEDLQETLENDFPFSIVVGIDGQDDNIIPIGATRNVQISVVWPLDGGNDVLDTQWGEDAYDFYQENGPTSTSVHIDLLLKVEQAE